ncbi:MAG: conjugal transfer protein TraF [Oceanospirillaceae bacterium]|nr:conjugal transfer protein TraF [Oceanospirillaceae bacterium]MCP5335800.1 conjugal transfer protein TraF [Oceanospirillaceae bacterium]MCP5349897.1 conjugal transfer protein TraF [Oceanospirillaceae bacterium]
MNNKILLSAAISAAISAPAFAVPFQVLDARTMGMGGTGVASAPLSSVVPYNPALMATYRSDDHFSLNLRGGLYVGDSDDVLDATDEFEPDVKADELNALIGESGCVDCVIGDLDDLTSSGADLATAITDITQAIADLQDGNGANDVAAANQLNTSRTLLNNSSQAFDDAAVALNAKAGAPDTPGGERKPLQQSVFGLTDYLDNTVSNSRIKFGGGLGFQIAVPSKTFSFALSLDSSISGSGMVEVSQDDTNLLEDIADATGVMVTDSLAASTDITGFAAAVDALADDPNNATLQAAVNVYINGDDSTAGGAGSIEETVTNITGKTITGTQTGIDIIENGALGDLDPDTAGVQEEPNLKSTIHLYGAAVSDIGIAIAREFEIKGKKVSFGITPKIQKINVFEFIAEVDGQDPATGQDIDFDNVEFDDYHKEYSAFNIDFGAAHRFGFSDRWQTGVVVKNLLGKSYKSTYGRKVDIEPQMRAGVSYENIDWWLKPKFAADLDITENKPTAFEDPTRFLALGAELDLFRTLQVRAGYRTNLSAGGQDIVSVGLGFSPLAIHMDLGAYMNTSDVKKEAGVAFELGVEF